MEGNRFRLTCSLCSSVPAMIVVLTFLLYVKPLLIAGGTHPETHQSHAGHDGMSMPMDEATDSATLVKQKAKLDADKRESEFNHHLAGLFVMVAGLFIFAQPRLTGRWPATKYIWPICFLVAGMFVLVWSDTELWPFGQRQWLEALRNNREVLQHKSFALLLLVLGIVEWLRTSGRLRAVWSSWVFPAVAILGSSILIFHEHEGGMTGGNHMEVMARIQSQHITYMLSGLGIGLSKGLSELRTSVSGAFGRIWPLLMVTLGILLLFYRE